jgi:hypothetical protein
MLDGVAKSPSYGVVAFFRISTYFCMPSPLKIPSALLAEIFA